MSNTKVGKITGERRHATHLPLPERDLRKNSEKKKKKIKPIRQTTSALDWRIAIEFGKAVKSHAQNINITQHRSQITSKKNQITDIF
jgi:hypothetical protein